MYGVPALAGKASDRPIRFAPFFQISKTITESLGSEGFRIPAVNLEFVFGFGEAFDGAGERS
jgi:hypothetical protein